MAAETDDLQVVDPPGAPAGDRSPRGRRAPGRRAPGRRAALRRRRRRRQLRWWVGSLVAGALAVLGLAWTVAGGDGSDRGDTPVPEAAPADGQAPAPDAQPTLVLATFDEADPAAGATQVTILAWDRGSGAGTVLLVPTTTVADIPGHGLLQLGRAFGFGEGPLLDATLDNLLGVDLDAVAGISRQGWASLLARTGGLTLEVPERLVERRADGSGETRFAAGEQFLDGPRLAELLTFREPDEPELDTLPRTQLVLGALLDAAAADPSVLDELFGDGAPMLELSPADHDPSHLRELFAGLAGSRERGDLVVRTLPVTPLGSGEDGSYRLDSERAERLVAERIGASVPVTQSAGGGRALEIRNGNGRPGAGQEVAQLLIPRGFRVVLTGNADRFDHPETRILIYEDTAEQRAIAREIRDVLGVGRIELSQAPQGIVDVTILVGHDRDSDG